VFSVASRWFVSAADQFSQVAVAVAVAGWLLARLGSGYSVGSAGRTVSGGGSVGEGEGEGQRRLLR